MPDVSITGLRLKSMLQGPVFWWHAIWSMGQARAAPGNISAGARTINGIHHTLTVWDSEAAMRSYPTTARILPRCVPCTAWRPARRRGITQRHRPAARMFTRSGRTGDGPSDPEPP